MSSANGRPNNPFVKTINIDSDQRLITVSICCLEQCDEIIRSFSIYRNNNTIQYIVGKVGTVYRVYENNTTNCSIRFCMLSGALEWLSDDSGKHIMLVASIVETLKEYNTSCYRSNGLKHYSLYKLMLQVAARRTVSGQYPPQTTFCTSYIIYNRYMYRITQAMLQNINYFFILLCHLCFCVNYPS